MNGREKLRWGVAGIFALPVIIGFILTIRVIGALSSVPVAIGKRINAERLARILVNRVVDMEVAYQFRDDLLYLMEEEIYHARIDSDELDRWGLLRQIDEDREEAVEDLQTGEFTLSMGGAILSIGIGVWGDIRFAGLGLTIILVFFSILVVLRVVVTDLLSYRSHEVRHDRIELLALKRGWNETQINHGSSLVLASILLTTSSSDWGYELGMRIIERFGTLSNPRATDRYSVANDRSE